MRPDRPRIGVGDSGVGGASDGAHDQPNLCGEEPHWWITKCELTHEAETPGSPTRRPGRRVNHCREGMRSIRFCVCGAGWPMTITAVAGSTGGVGNRRCRCWIAESARREDQGCTGARRRWLGVNAALSLRRHARRTPSRSCESPPDQYSSPATQIGYVLLAAVSRPGPARGSLTLGSVHAPLLLDAAERCLAVRALAERAAPRTARLAPSRFLRRCGLVGFLEPTLLVGELGCDVE